MRKRTQKDNNKSVLPSVRTRRRNESANVEASINMEELRELIALMTENGLSEFELERETFRVRLRRDTEGRVAESSILKASAVPAEEAVQLREVKISDAAARSSPPNSPLHPGAQAETAALEDQNLHIITSPIVGTFYRTPSPNAEAFVKIGSHVEPDSIVCIIEAMKLMNEIQAETSGEVVKIYVENGQPVEYGQPLFGISR